MFASDKYLSWYLMMHYNKFPNTLQLEISSNCNLGCPGCVRTVYDPISSYDDPAQDITIENLRVSTHPDIAKNKFLSVDTVKQLLSATSSQQVKRIEFIGTIDDPLMHPQFLEIIEHIVSLNTISIVIHTNASLRNPQYFADMARILEDPRHVVCFSIDGLQDTNSLYRRGSQWQKIMDNAQAYIQAGARSRWQYLIFDWNKHQVEQAKQLAAQMGFTEFTSRNDRAFVDIDFNLQARNTQGTSWSSLQRRLDARADDPIDCKMQHMYFVNHLGEVWPCCFFANRVYINSQDVQQKLNERFVHYGENWNNLNYYSFDEILNNKFYTDDLVASWSSCSHGTGAQDRVTRCTQTCSVRELKRRSLGDHQNISL
jgi:MoaA/NifB/PqqE/SkfB family radical SAM enzyme